MKLLRRLAIVAGIVLASISMGQLPQQRYTVSGVFREYTNTPQLFMPVLDIPAELLDEVEYFRARLLPTYQLEPWHGSWSIDRYEELNGPTGLKANHPHLKTLVGLGIYSDRPESYEASQMAAFREILANSSAMNSFCTSVDTFLNQYGFDGICINWEWPQLGTNEKTQFPVLLEALRSKLGTGKLIHVQITGNNGLSGAGEKYNLSQWNLADPRFVNNVDAIYANTIDYDVLSSSAADGAKHNSPLFRDPNSATLSQCVHAGIKGLYDIGGASLLSKVRLTITSGVQRFAVSSTHDIRGSQRTIASPVLGYRMPYSGSTANGGWPLGGDDHYVNFVSNVFLKNAFDGYILQYDPVHVADSLFKPIPPYDQMSSAGYFVSYQGLRSLADKMYYVRNETLPYNLEAYPVWQQPGAPIGGVRLWSSDIDYLADKNGNYQWGLQQGIEDYLFSRRPTGYDTSFVYPSGPNQGSSISPLFGSVYGHRNSLDYTEFSSYYGNSSPWDGGSLTFTPATQANSGDWIRFHNVFQNVNTAIASGDHQRNSLRFDIVHMSDEFGTVAHPDLKAPKVKIYVWRYDGSGGWYPLTIDGTSSQDYVFPSYHSWQRTRATLTFPGFAMWKVMGPNGQVSVRVNVRASGSDSSAPIPKYIVDRILLTNPRDN